MDTNFSVTRKLILEEAKARGYEVSYLPLEERDQYIYVLSDGTKQVWLKGTLSNGSSSIGNLICRNKILTLEYAQSIGFTVPPFEEFSRMDEALLFIREHGPIVVKPLNGMRSQGVTTNIHSEDEFREALEKAKSFSKDGRVVMQQMLRGKLYRLLVVGDRLFGAIRREAPFVVGDNLHTVAELIGLENLSPDRSTEQDSRLRPIHTNVASEYLAERMQAILSEGEVLEVTPVPLISQGAQTYDVTDEVHPSYVKAVIDFTRKLDLATCGFDLITPDISQSMGEALPLLEANSMPAFGMHTNLTHGQPRNAAPAFLDLIFGKTPQL